MSFMSRKDVVGGIVVVLVLVLALLAAFFWIKPASDISYYPTPDPATEVTNALFVQNNPVPMQPIDAVAKLYNAIETRSWAQYVDAFEPSALLEAEAPGTPGAFSDMQITQLADNPYEALVGVIGKWTPSAMSDSEARSIYIDEEIRVVKAKKAIFGSVEIGGGSKVNLGVGAEGWFIAYDQSDKLPFDFSGQNKGLPPPKPKGTFAFCHGPWLILSDGEGKWYVSAVSDLQGCGDLSWTPEGQSILFSRREDTNRNKKIDEADAKRFYLLELPSLNQIPILPEQNDIQFEGYSPDGAWVVLSSGSVDQDNSFSKDLFLATRDGSRVVKLTEGLEGGLYLGWSSGSHRVFLASRGGSSSPSKTENSHGAGIYAIDPADLGRDFFSAEIDIDHVAWAPDKMKMAFSSSGKIHVLEPNSGKLFELGTGADKCSEFAWFPDSARMLLQCSSADTQGGDIWVVNTNGTELKMLTDGSRRSYAARCSPNGAHVAFVRDSEENGPEIWVMKSDGTEKTLLREGDSDMSTPPQDLQWSPDSMKLAFSASYADLAPEMQRLFVTDLRSSTTRRLTTALNLGWFRWLSNEDVFVVRLRQAGTATSNRTWAWAVQIMDVTAGAWRWQTPPQAKLSFLDWTRADHSPLLADLSAKTAP